MSDDALYHKINWQSPLLLLKIAARKSLLRPPVRYPQLKRGKRELLGTPCICVSLNRKYKDHAGYTVSERGYYHCYGCSAYGHSTSLLTQYFGLTHDDALAYCVSHSDLGKPLPHQLTSRFIHQTLDPLFGAPL